MDLDPTDRAILSALQEDARRSMRELASLSGVSTPTASERVRRLEALGLIRGYQAVLDPRLLGRAAYVLEVRARPADAPALAQRLRAMEGVAEVMELAGGRLLARCFSRAHHELQTFLGDVGRLEAVQSYALHPLLAEHAGETSLLDETTRLAVACHLCKGPIHGAGIHKRLQEGERERDHWFCCKHCASDFEARLRTLERAAPRAPPRGAQKARKKM